MLLSLRNSPGTVQGVASIRFFTGRFLSTHATAPCSRLNLNLVCNAAVVREMDVVGNASRSFLNLPIAHTEKRKKSQ